MPIRVLHVVTYMGRGGLETMIMNYYRHIDRTKVQFDFLVHRSFEADYDSEILSLGGKIYHLPNLNPFSRNYLNHLNQFFKEHSEYKIVHCHLDCMAGIPLKAAEKNGVPVRIAHSHISNQTKDKKYLLKLLYKRMIPKYSTKRFACGEEAGRWMFNGAEFEVMNNAIDTSLYLVNKKTGLEVRKELGIPEEAVVIGHVGRFAPPKNHTFIVDCFNELLKEKMNAYLLLVGEGELKQEIVTKVSGLGISDHVIFAGLRTDVNRMLQAMDVFLFPSLYEGLPVSLIEAQAAGLPCLISDKVPIECKKTDLVYQYSLKDNASKWVEYIERALYIQKKNTQKQIAENGFDIKVNAEKLQNFYLQEYKKAGGVISE